MIVTLVLAALGYRNIYGVDIGGRINHYNEIVDAAGVGTPQFFEYDGKHIPISDHTVDFIFSQQVLEHVSDDVIEAFYAEESRLLRAGGFAYHQVPHRLVLYDSHTRTWFIHYFPRTLRRPAYRWLGHDPDYVEDLLHLRWPGFHRKI